MTESNMAWVDVGRLENLVMASTCDKVKLGEELQSILCLFGRHLSHGF